MGMNDVNTPHQLSEAHHADELPAPRRTLS